MSLLARRRSLRAFTLIELIVVILILGILAAVATVGYSMITERAQDARAQANLRNVAQLTIAQATLTDADLLTRDLLSAAIEGGVPGVTVVQGIEAGQTWHLGLKGQTPVDPTDLAVAFDNGDGVATDDGGSRAVLLAAAGDHLQARIVNWGQGADGPLLGHPGWVPAGTTPEEVLADPGLITDGPEGADPGAGENNTNPGVDTGGPDIGDLDVTLTPYSSDWEADGKHTQLVEAIIPAVPAGTAMGEDGLKIWCTVDVPIKGGVAGYGTVDPDWGGGYVTWGATRTIAPATRTYTCTVEAYDNSGTVLARRTVSATAGPGQAPTPPASGTVKLTYDTTAPGCPDNTITLPFVGPAGTVDWGDGTVEDGTQWTEHTYAPGRHTLTFTGTFPAMNLLNSNDPSCLISFDSWTGNTLTTSMSQAFAEARNLVSVVEPPASVTDYSTMFYRASAFNQDISGWDLSHVTSTEAMFYSASSFNQNIGGWDMSNVTNTQGMFAYANAFNQDIGNWNTSKVTTMRVMFMGNQGFNQDIRRWDTSAVTSMLSMFDGATKFNQDLSAWNVGNVVDYSNFASRAPQYTKAKPAFH